MSNQNQELTAKQLPALSKTVLDLVNMPFGENQIREYTQSEIQLRNLDLDLRKQGLGYIFSRVTILSGFKGEIPDINKVDITELLLTRFETLSLSELNYAFKIDRHGYHGDPTPHYQLFNAEYVVKVLNKYLIHKTNVKNRPKRY